jgi:hypothetical protein
MDRFLTNYNYDTYNGQELNFNKYICKDCTQKKKEYEYDNSNRQPKDVSNIGYIEVLSGLYPVKIQTPTMVCPFGFNRQTNQIYLQFSNLKTDPEMKGFLNCIQSMEHQQMKYIGLTSEDIDLYISQIKYDKKEKYDPNLVIKVPFRANRYEVDVRTSDNECSIANIYNFSKMKCDIYIDNIWKFNGKFVCKWKVSRILLV